MCSRIGRAEQFQLTHAALGSTVMRGAVGFLRFRGFQGFFFPAPVFANLKEYRGER